MRNRNKAHIGGLGIMGRIRGRLGKVAVSVMMLCLLFLSAGLPLQSAASSTSGNLLASFPCLSLGSAGMENGGVRLSFDCAGADSTIMLDGRALRFDVKAGTGNNGTLSLLLDEGCMASTEGAGRLVLKWRRNLPKAGDKLHFGEAVLALPRQPGAGGLSISRIPPSASWVRANKLEIGPATTTTVSALSGKTMEPVLAPVTTAPGFMLPSDYIVRLPLWIEVKTGNLLSISLGAAPRPVSGKILAPVPEETLRYVSSDVLLPANYKPNLRWTSYLLCLQKGEAFQFHPDVVLALREMLNDAQKQGVSGFDLDNSYRSAVWQKQLFDRRLNWSKADKTIADPLAATLRRVARPFGSEHQTGLGFDMSAISGYGADFARTANFRWLMSEGWKYGFVVRYPNGWEPTTKVMFEPWHIRYLGKPMAGYLAEQGIPYEGFVEKAKDQGVVWLGDTETGSKTVWLAVTATNKAVYASGEDSLSPVISSFLPDRNLWLIPFRSELP